MKQQVVKLVNVIIEHLEEQPDMASSEKKIRTWLSGEGYSSTDIEAALRLLGIRPDERTRLRSRIPGSVRQLSSFEAGKLSRDARDALARLDLYELIDPVEREMLLDRLSQFDGEVTMDDMDYLLSWLLGSTRDVESCQTVFNVFEGQATLH